MKSGPGFTLLYFKQAGHDFNTGLEFGLLVYLRLVAEFVDKRKPKTCHMYDLVTAAATDPTKGQSLL